GIERVVKIGAGRRVPRVADGGGAGLFLLLQRAGDRTAVRPPRGGGGPAARRKGGRRGNRHKAARLHRRAHGAASRRLGLETDLRRGNLLGFFALPFGDHGRRQRVADPVGG